MTSGAESWADQVEVVIRMLNSRKLERGGVAYQTALRWISNFPIMLGEEKRAELTTAFCTAFGMIEVELYAALSGITLPPSVATTTASREAKLRSVLPAKGWFAAYDQYTRQTESPLSYHIFSSLCVLGASLGRRVNKPMGFFSIPPNFCSILVGPTGKVKKTSAVDIAKNLITKNALCPVMADKLTPEALIGALVESGHHFIYAPEFSIFFGKQRYMEGLTTLIIRLLDCPLEYKVKTLTRGEEILTNVAITLLGGSTMSLLTSATPEEVTSSGFLNRFVLVVEEDTERCFPQPSKGPKDFEDTINNTIKAMVGFEGEVEWNVAAFRLYSDWYKSRKELLRKETSEMQAEIMQRSPEHLIRIAMLTHLAHCGTQTICTSCMEVAMHLINYLDGGMPATIRALEKSPISKEADLVLRTLHTLGGASDHSKLLRRLSAKMDAATFKRHIHTLVETRQLKEEKRGTMRYYILTSGDGNV